MAPETSPPRSTAPLQSPYATQTNVTRATLANGLRVVIVHNALAPVVTTEMNYLVGSDDVPKGFPGTAHALEHVVFRGGAGLSRDQLSEVAANMGGAYDADTTEGVTQFYYVAPADDLDVALQIEALSRSHVYIKDANWTRERGAIEQEVSRDMSNPQSKVLTQLRAYMVNGTHRAWYASVVRQHHGQDAV